MWAGSLSHNGLTGLGRITLWVSHQIEHEISGMFEEVAHGAGLLAVVFPAWMKYAYKYNILFLPVRSKGMELRNGLCKP